MNDSTKFYVNELKKLNGHKILRPVSSPPDDWGCEFFGLLLEKDGDKKIMWILQDDEGNGPGGFEIQPVKE